MAEYEFREGAVPILVLIQSDEGRINLNQTLTSEGVLASLKAKNAILNVLAPGRASNDNARDPEYFDLFQIDSGTARVLGVESDHDSDGLHNAVTYSYVSASYSLGTAVFDDTVNSLDTIVGELENDADGNGALGETEHSYVRLAWATGGAAWDIGILDDDAGLGTTDQAEREASLADTFSTSLANQIKDAYRAGRTNAVAEVVAAINYGGLAIAAEGFAADPSGVQYPPSVAL